MSPTYRESYDDGNTLTHRLPLGQQGGREIEAKIPRDLTAKEAERICAWIRTLALTPEPDEAKAQGETP